MINKISLIQPRHIYAPDSVTEPLGHVYMPTSLLSIAAILIDSGVEVSISDDNIASTPMHEPIMGINLVGSPYVPIAIQFAKRLSKCFHGEGLLLIGGQLVNGLSDTEIASLFGFNTFNGNSLQVLSSIFNLDPRSFKTTEDISLVNAYAQLSDCYMKLYLSHEFCFYLSQGCKYSCAFCAAQRSIFDPSAKIIHHHKEVYRNLDIALNDLEYLICKAKSYGINELALYLSNLDLFQNPANLSYFAEHVIYLKKQHPAFSLHLRGLSNVRSFLHTHKTQSNTIVMMMEAGLERIGFGIDGASPRIWKENRKPQNKSECIQAISIARKTYGLIPEALMVFGYAGSDNPKTLQLAYDFAKCMYDKYEALPRPHVAKDIVPGNDGWRNPHNRFIVDYLIHNPILFQNLDFTSLPSPITHPNGENRKSIIHHFTNLCNLPYSLTRYVKPYICNMSDTELGDIRNFNMKKYDI